MVIAAVAALRHRRTAELSAPDHQRIVQHAALFQVRDQRSGRLIHFFGLERHVGFYTAMMVPIAVIELDEPHAAFGQPARQQAVGGERPVTGLRAVHVENLLRLLAHVHKVRDAALHLERHLVLRHARQNLRILERGVLRRG